MSFFQKFCLLLSEGTSYDPNCFLNLSICPFPRTAPGPNFVEHVRFSALVSFSLFVGPLVPSMSLNPRPMCLYSFSRNRRLSCPFPIGPFPQTNTTTYLFRARTFSLNGDFRFVYRVPSEPTLDSFDLLMEIFLVSPRDYDVQKSSLD